MAPADAPSHPSPTDTSGAPGSSSVPTDDPFRAALHQMWSTAAPGWERHADHVDERGATVTAALLAGAGVVPGQDVVDLACGPGGVALAAAGVVGPAGSVVAGDIAPEMVAIAAARASGRGLGQVSARILDLEAVELPDASADAVVCREGLMLVPEPARALAEIARVLRPGGRVAVAVWGPRARNPWIGVLLDAISAHVGVPIPPPGLPGPFSLDDPDLLLALFEGAGFGQVGVQEVAEPMAATDTDSWWGTVTELAGPVAQVLAGMAVEDQVAIRAAAEAGLEPYRVAGGGFELPGVSLVACGRR